MIVIYAVLAALWLLLIAYAQLHCSIFESIGTQCRGPELDVWMLPLFTAPIGGLAVLGFIFKGLVWRFRRQE
jgi:hypothetical protein